VATHDPELDQGLVEEAVGNAHGNLELVKELVEAHPALVQARAPWNESAVEAATQMGRRDIIEYLVSRGASVDFFTACALGRTDQVEAELRADPQRARARGVHDLPALYFAGVGGQLEIAELLLRHGADVNESAKGAAPIHGAVMGGRPELVSWMLSRGADPEMRDFQGRSARELALAMDRPDLAALLD
jgi:ankyrin repeat protein